MKKITKNSNNLKDEEINEVVKRVKILLINSKNEVLLGYSHNTYQFPGGHVDDGESLIQTVNREIQEETGMILNVKNIKPFACAIGYYKDWPKEGTNRKTEIYYYEVKTNDKPNLDNTKYTDSEKEGKFELRYISLADVVQKLNNNIKQYGDNKGIAKEMLELFEIYNQKD